MQVSCTLHSKGRVCTSLSEACKTLPSACVACMLPECRQARRRIELLRQETADAERRAQQVADEMKELVGTLNAKQKGLDDKQNDLDMCVPALLPLASKPDTCAIQHRASVIGTCLFHVSLHDRFPGAQQ